MSRQDPNYSAALDKAEEVWSPAVGLTSSSTSITDIAKQNNTIIELLVSLHKRLARVELAAQKQPESDLLIKNELGNITSKLANLEIGRASSQAVKKVLGNKSKVYQHYSEETIFCVGNQEVNLDFVSTESRRKLEASGFATIHLGAILIGIYGMHREHIGSKVNLVLVDTRFKDPRQVVIGQMEVDMHNNYELVYIIPKDLQLTVKDFCRHIKLVVKTKGYEDMVSGEANLLIVRALTARVSNYIASHFQLKTENIAQFLGSQGIKAIPGKSFDPKDLNGQIWEISIPHEITNTAPQAAVTWQTHRRSMTTRYTTYENQTHKDDRDLFTDPPVCDEYDDETSFINPFATSELQKSVVGEKQNLLEKFTLLEVDNDLPYPTRKPEHLLMSEANSNFNQVPTGSGLSNAAIGPARYLSRTINVPPINQWASTSTRPLGRIPDDKPIVLPPARAESGVFLTLPKNIARWEDAIRSWESSTIIHMAKMNFGDNTDKVIYFENLLGPKEKLDFQQWKAAYPDEYQRLIEIAGETQNLTSQVRQMLLGYDEYRGDTKMQDQALSQLDRLTITDMKDFPDYAYQFHDLASKTGRMYLQTELSEKFFRKFPPPFGAKIMELWDRDHPGMGVGIVPRIKYTFEVLQQLCQQNEINRQAKDFSFCKAIEVPGAYPRNKPRRSLRRSTTYKGGAPPQ
ncbi:hypothetical protein RIF29_37918 [Crotalaria pallida]|uniref:Uncharacterized protein n=1 Tax=Crotalaria pallida TaxID=3830 RepID=A0AAN9E0Q0_CROPI